MWRTGGYIGRRAVPTLTSASGVWQLPELETAMRDVIWPPPFDRDPYWTSTVLLLHGDGANNSTTFTDSSPSALSITRIDGPVISTAQSKFGGSSMYFDGVSDALQLPSSAALNLSTGPYTIEFWMRTNGTQTAYSAMFSRWSSAPTAGGSSSVECYNSYGTAQVRFVPASGATAITSSTNVNDGAWHHIACVRSGTNAYLFIDGTLSVSTATLSAAASATISSGRIGRSQQNNNADNNYLGFIDDFRVTKSARYTSAFTVPAFTFPDK